MKNLAGPKVSKNPEIFLVEIWSILKQTEPDYMRGKTILTE